MVGPVALEGSSRERSARFLFGWTSGSGCEGDDGLRTFRMRTYSGSPVYVRTYSWTYTNVRSVYWLGVRSFVVRRGRREGHGFCDILLSTVG
jgi:hypothetical protein